MRDERRQRLLDQYEDAALQLLMDEYAETEGKLLQKEFEAAEKRGEVTEVPEELDLACRQIIHKNFSEKQRRERFTIAAKTQGKVAVIVLTLLSLSATIAMSVEAFRIPILNFLISHDIRYSTLLFLDESEPATENFWQNVNIEDCVPSDYSLTYKQFSSDGASTHIFSNKNNDLITINTAPAEGMFNYDSEDASQEPMTINNYDAIYIYGKNYRVMWFNTENKYVFDVVAEGLPESDFWKLVFRLAELT